MAFTKLKNHISNLATPFAANAINNFMSGGSAQAAGKVAAKLKDKSPFNIDSAPSQKLIENPLSFSPVQYPLDLGSNELGHYIIFESGFIGYSPQQGGMFNSGKKKGKKVTSKVPNKSIMNSAIALYMPSSIKASYSQDYGAEETGVSGDIEGALMRNASGGESADQIKAFLSAGTNTAIKKGKQLLGEAVQLVGLGDPIKFMMKRAGTAINPRNELFYEGPGMRDFTYTFDFWPRNMKEADAVRDIITIFKYNSAPGFKDNAGALFEIPNYFKISYMYNGEVNTKLNLISACYCTGVEVNYTPDGQPSFFPDGQPVHTNLTVSFKEDRVLTKEDIEEGA
jgi:hypothetical protein